MLQKNAGNSGLIQYRFKTYTIIYCALGPKFYDKIKYEGGPTGDLKNYFWPQGTQKLLVFTIKKW